MVKIIIDWITQYAAGVIALLAMIATFWQGFISRRHNRLSVVPYLATFVHYDNDTEHFEVTGNLINKGVGPAKINDIKILLDDDVMPIKDTDDFENLLKNLVGKRLLTLKTSHLTKSYMFTAHESMTLINLKFPPSTNDEINDIKRELERIALVLDYESIYGTKYQLDTREEKTKSVIENN